MENTHNGDAENPLTKQTHENGANGCDIHETFKPVSDFRRILPQVLASCAKNLLILDLAMSMNFPTIAIPALRGIQGKDPNEVLVLTDFQASWFASIAFICQPIGSVFSGIILEQLGRKNTMMLVNIPHIVAWLMLYYAQDLQTLFTADILLGLGVGFMEAPVITYVGEISEPSVRGVLTSVAGVSYTLGCFLLYLIGAFVSWRTTALISCSVPIITIFCVSFVPETPLWLLSKGRKRDAIKALQWLRGWVPPQAVAQEFNNIQRYNDLSTKCNACQKADIKCTHPQESVGQRFRELFRKNTMKGFFIIISCFLFSTFGTGQTMRAFYIQIFEKYNMAIEPSRMVILVGIVSFIGTISSTIGIKLFGKRKMSLFSMVCTAVFLFCLSVYTWRLLPKGLTSFDKETKYNGAPTYTPIVLFCSIIYFASIGISAIAWIMISEIFPNKTRGMASGICAAISYIIGFIATKTYYDLEMALSLFGVISFYTVLSFVGILFVYFFLPETEGRTLEEIEEHFSNNKLKLTNHKIEFQELLRK